MVKSAQKLTRERNLRRWKTSLKLLHWEGVPDTDQTLEPGPPQNVGPNTFFTFELNLSLCIDDKKRAHPAVLPMSEENQVSIYVQSHSLTIVSIHCKGIIVEWVADNFS